MPDSGTPFEFAFNTRRAREVSNSQKGTSPLRSVPLSRRRAQISRANSDLRPGGVARIISTASRTFIGEPIEAAYFAPFLGVIAPTAKSHSARFAAPPCFVGLYWWVGRPTPAARNVLAQRTLSTRQVHIRLAGELSSSRPLTWPTSTLRREPQNAHIRGPGGGHAFAR